VGLAGPLLRRLGIDPGIKRYVAVGVRPDEIEVTVTLERRGERRDVSDSCSMVSLRPFRLAIASPADPGEQPADLWFEGSDRRQLGHLRIEPIGRTGPDRGYPLYRTVGSRDACVGRAELWANYLRFEVERRKRISAKDPFPLSGLSLWSILIFYIRPRPVVIVSVGAAGRANLFPMDILGLSEDGAFLMALRSTSPNVAIMRETKRIAMGEVPLEFRDLAYTLASGHSRLRDPNEAFPFEVMDSPNWRLPIPTQAVRVREVEVKHVDEVGSHHLFTTRIVHDVGSDAARLHHVSGFYERARRKQGRPLSVSSSQMVPAFGIDAGSGRKVPT
jgi:flavin reductase (DIM6/NTAB) family NADH-FMN oxidoreductase RutF